MKKYCLRVKERRNILHEIRKRKANWIGHISRRNCLLQRVNEGKIKGRIEVIGRRGRRRRKLLDDLKERRGYSHLKEEALDRTTWRARFGRGLGPVVRQTAKWMNIWFRSVTLRVVGMPTETRWWEFCEYNTIHHKHLSAFVGQLYTLCGSEWNNWIAFFHSATEYSSETLTLYFAEPAQEDYLENTALIICNFLGSSTKIRNDVCIVPTLQFVSHREYPSAIPD